MMYPNDLYQILNLEPDATLKDIKSQFRKLSLKYHPDKAKDSEEVYNLVTLAYSVLSNPDTRREYDQMYYIEKRSQNFESLKSTFKEYKVPPSTKTKEELEKEVENRHKDLFVNFQERDIKDYTKKREEQEKLKPIQKDFDFEREEPTEKKITTHSAPSAILPSNVTKYQEINKVGEMYSNTVESTAQNYILNVSTKSFQPENPDEKIINYKVETEVYQNMKASDYKSKGELILDKIILQ